MDVRAEAIRKGVPKDRIDEFLKYAQDRVRLYVECGDPSMTIEKLIQHIVKVTYDSKTPMEPVIHFKRQMITEW